MQTHITFDVPLEIRTDAGQPPKLVGVAIPWNTLSKPITGTGNVQFRERFLPGAFTEDLANGRDTRALVNHDTTMILGRRSNKTLTVTETKAGLEFEIIPPDTTYADDLMELVRRGDVSGVSIAFGNPVGSFSIENGEKVRTISKAMLGELSPTGQPAYPGTSVEARNLDATELAELEALSITTTPPALIDYLASQRHCQLLAMSR